MMGKKPAAKKATKPKIAYSISLQIRGEGREAPYKPPSIGAGVEWCLDYCNRNRGCKASLSVTVPQNVLIEHTFTIFECQYPTLDDWMLNEIKGYFGDVPPELEQRMK